MEAIIGLIGVIVGGLLRASHTLGRIRGLAAFQLQEGSEPEERAQPGVALKRADWRTVKS